MNDEPKSGLEATALFLRDMEEGFDRIKGDATLAEQRIIKAAAFGELVAKRMFATPLNTVDGVVALAEGTIADYRKIYGDNDNG